MAVFPFIITIRNTFCNFPNVHWAVFQSVKLYVSCANYIFKCAFILIKFIVNICFPVLANLVFQEDFLYVYLLFLNYVFKLVFLLFVHFNLSLDDFATPVTSLLFAIICLSFYTFKCFCKFFWYLLANSLFAKIIASFAFCFSDHFIFTKINSFSF